MKHTPGKWKVYHDINVMTDSKNPSFIASCGMNNNIQDTLETCKANARLIAAAPELLEACKEALELPIDPIDEIGTSSILTKIQQVIAKAEGKE